MKRNEDKFIKRGRIFVLVMGLLCLMNIIILIGKNSSFALFRRNVQSKRIVEIHTAKEFPSKLGIDILKKTLGQEGGIIGVTEDNQKVTEAAENIREYRYSGLGVKNYVKFNNELWRIIGVFKDEAGEEHMKIVRDEVLPASAMPDTYVANGKTFKIRYSSSSATAYWDYDGSAYDNNWADAGLMNWLNSKGTEDGYLKTLTSEAQGMIEETKYYLGTLTWDSTNFMKDTIAEAYNYERVITGCSENKGSTANSSGNAVTGNSTCRVWTNNAAYWEGEIALMYPSEYGYTVDSNYWTNTMISSKGLASTVVETSWLFKEANHSSSTSEWFLSPSSYSTYHVARWATTGDVYVNGVNSRSGVRPTLYLKSDVQIINGYGTSSEPYELAQTAVEKVKSTLGKTGGIIGVTTSNTKVTKESENIREYRYSGLGVKNYVKFNNELWRILGIFKDESGIEHMKIVRDETLSGIPSSYTANGKTFNLSGGTSSRWDTDSGYDNNWADAGLMNWLNSTGTENGYLKTLTSASQKMIEEAKYYLGSLTYDSTNYMKDTVAEAYNYERAVTGCIENKGSSANSSKSAVEENSTCRVWANNAATWTGKIALMYPSDYGYTVDSNYWTNTMISSKGFTSTVVETSWLFKEANYSNYEWLLSPSTLFTDDVARWHTMGNVGSRYTGDNLGVRPSLNLKSSVSIISGIGEKGTPYILG